MRRRKQDPTCTKPSHLVFSTNSTQWRSVHDPRLQGPTWSAPTRHILRVSDHISVLSLFFLSIICDIPARDTDCFCVSASVDDLINHALLGLKESAPDNEINSRNISIGIVGPDAVFRPLVSRSFELLLTRLTLLTLPVNFRTTRTCNHTLIASRHLHALCSYVRHKMCVRTTL